MRADVVVVGGGLSGLAVAAQLTAAGLEVLLLEASGAARRPASRGGDRRVPGRRRPARAHQLARARRPRRAGAHPADAAQPARLLPRRTAVRGRRGAADAVRRRRAGPSTRADSAQQSMATRLAPIGSVTDRARLSTEFYRLARGSIDASLTGREDASGESFTSRGYSPVLVDGFLRRYLTALAADEDLAASDPRRRLAAQDAGTRPVRRARRADSRRWCGCWPIGSGRSGSCSAPARTRCTPTGSAPTPG